MLTDPGAAASGDGLPFAAAFRASRRALIVTDPRRPGNPVVFTNAACERLTGYAPAEMIGRKWVDGKLVDNPDAKWAIRIGMPMR